MKHLSIRMKITLWFALAMITLAGLTIGCVLMISDNVIQKNIRDDLIAMVSDNVDEVEYYEKIKDANPDGDRDIYLSYKNGFLEIDDDYLDQMNGIYTILYDENHNLLYGEDLISEASQTLAFQNNETQTVKKGGKTYYVYDRSLKEEGMEDLWLRGIVSRDEGALWMNEIVLFSLGMIPLLITLALGGGYFLAGRFLRPIQEMIRAAASIQEGQDLGKRIVLQDGRDELHQLADTFNSMMDRIESSFEAERQFTNDMSHELRTPVAVILSQCELSLEEDRLPSEYKHDLTLIQRQGNKLASMVNDMLHMCRLERQEEIELHLVMLHDICERVCKDLILVKERGITLTYQIDQKCIVMGDEEMLRRLITNLVNNAYRYGKDNGWIHVDLHQTEKEVLLEVRDNGKGIAPEHIPHIWQRFYQADASRKNAGSGLGLAMVQKIATLHHGYMEVSSVVDEGSCFILHLPRP